MVLILLISEIAGFMQAIGIRIPSQIANLITTLQFGQMIVGLFVNVLSMYYYGK